MGLFLANPQIAHFKGILYPEKYECRSQDLPPVYHDAALFYMASPDIWLGSSRIYRDDASIMEIPADRVCDIDTLEDWSRAEFLLNGTL